MFDHLILELTSTYRVVWDGSLVLLKDVVLSRNPKPLVDGLRNPFSFANVLTDCTSELCNASDTYLIPWDVRPLAGNMFVMIWELVQHDTLGILYPNPYPRATSGTCPSCSPTTYRRVVRFLQRTDVYDGPDTIPSRPGGLRCRRLVISVEWIGQSQVGLDGR